MTVLANMLVPVCGAHGSCCCKYLIWYLGLSTLGVCARGRDEPWQAAWTSLTWEVRNNVLERRSGYASGPPPLGLKVKIDWPQNPNNQI